MQEHAPQPLADHQDRSAAQPAAQQAVLVPIAPANSEEHSSEEEVPDEQGGLFGPVQFKLRAEGQRKGPAYVSEPVVQRIQRVPFRVSADGAEGEVIRRDDHVESWLTPEQEQRIETLRRELESLGVDHGKTGTLTGLFDITEHWTDMQRLEALSALRGIAVGSRYFGGRDRIIRAWNSGLDDLGVGRVRARYPTILHYVLIGLGGEGYVQYLADRIRNIRIAGREVPVNTRLIYFTAAAQAGMDERLLTAQSGERENLGHLSESEAVGNIGQGHYIPMGAFWYQLFNFDRVLGTLAYSNTRRRTLRTTPMGNSAATIQAIHRQLRFMLDVAHGQAENRDIPGYDHREHREPEMRAFLMAQAEAINSFVVPSAPAELPAAAATLQAVVSGFRAGTRRHGSGSVDPHGTDHALGFAIDLHNGAGSGGGYRNVETYMNDYWPFIRYVMQHEPQSGIRFIPGIDDLHSLQPNEALNLQQLITSRGQHYAQQIRERAQTLEGISPAERNAARTERRAMLSQFSRIRLSIYRQLNTFSNALPSRSISALSALSLSAEDIPVRNRFVQAFQSLYEYVRSQLAPIRLSTPDSLMNIVQENLNRKIQELVAALPGMIAIVTPEIQRLQSTPPRQRRRAPRTLDRLQRITSLGTPLSEITAFLQERMETIQTTRGELDAAVETQSIIDLSELVNSGGFQRWLGTVSNPDTPFYDQPVVMVESIAAVQSHPDSATAGMHFYGGHHWHVAPRQMRNDPLMYEQALTRDMNIRNESQLRRILNIMAESEGGRQALFGLNYANESPSSYLGAGDPIFSRVLAEKLENEPAEMMLREVFEDLVAPYLPGTGSGDRQERGVSDTMRSMGIHIEAGTP